MCICVFGVDGDGLPEPLHGLLFPPQIFQYISHFVVAPLIFGINGDDPAKILYRLFLPPQIIENNPHFVKYLNIFRVNLQVFSTFFQSLLIFLYLLLRQSFYHTQVLGYREGDPSQLFCFSPEFLNQFPSEVSGCIEALFPLILGEADESLVNTDDLHSTVLLDEEDGSSTLSLRCGQTVDDVSLFFAELFYYFWRASEAPLMQGHLIWIVGVRALQLFSQISEYSDPIFLFYPLLFTLKLQKNCSRGRVFQSQKRVVSGGVVLYQKLFGDVPRFDRIVFAKWSMLSRIEPEALGVLFGFGVVYVVSRCEDQVGGDEHSCPQSWDTLLYFHCYGSDDCVRQFPDHLLRYLYRSLVSKTLLIFVCLFYPFVLQTGTLPHLDVMSIIFIFKVIQTSQRMVVLIFFSYEKVVLNSQLSRIALGIVDRLALSKFSKIDEAKLFSPSKDNYSQQIGFRQQKKMIYAEYGPTELVEPQIPL